MYNTRKLTDDLTWIGGIDRKIQKFENVYKLNSGMNYNSYFLDCGATVLFDTVGRETADIFFENLPVAVSTAYQEGNYANWVIDDLTKLTFPQKPEEFVFEVQQGGQERALYYSEYGGLLREKDISDTDNTHWPDIS